jgi:hypothetical protein
MNVLKYDVNIPLYILKFDEHHIIKNDLLHIISNQESEKIIDDDQSISKTDWKLEIGKRREYFDFLSQYIKPYLFKIFEDMEVPGVFNFGNVWFQQYCKHDTHEWHTHGGSVWSGIYYLEFPKDGPATTFAIPYMKEYYTPKIEEGDILLFPSLLMHKSPGNTSDGRKTVIVFNIGHN